RDVMSLKRCQLYRGERYELNGAQYSERDYGSINSQDRQIMLQDDEDSDQGLIMRGTSPIALETQVITDSSTYFRDGRRKIDFVLVYEESSGRSGGSLASRRSSSIASAVIEAGQATSGDKKTNKHDNWRQRFMAYLRRAGLDMEEEVIETNNKKLVCFIKLHATWPVLCHYAEELNMRAPLQTVTANTYLDMLQLYAVPQLPDGAIFQQDGAPPHFANMVRTFLDEQFPARWIGRGSPYITWPARSPDLTPPDFFPVGAHPNPSVNWSHLVLKALRLPNIMYEEVPNKPLDYYTCPFRKSKLDRFLGSENRDTYFTNVQRGRILYEILSTAIFGKKKKGEVGIDRLVEEGVFSSAFPLHDGPYEVKKKKGVPECPLNARQILYEYWARWGKWYKYQPLDHIREYFGEKIAIYFAWLVKFNLTGFYTGWLLPAALVGLLVFLYGLFTMHSNQLATEVCNSGGEFNMCPLCDLHVGCNFWNLSEVCSYAQLAYLFDHPGTVFYAVFVSFWAVTFLEYWKRKSASLAHHWDCMGFQEEEERPRPEFAARAPFLERNPVTGIREPSFPSSLRNKRVAAGIGIIFLMISLVIIFIVAVIIYRVLVSIPLFQNSTFRSQAQAIANMTGAVVNLILIMAMSRVYEKLAYRLTAWEMHRTQTEFDDNLTFKVFIFQFVNFYSSIFYIAFFKGRFVGYPGNYTRILRLRNEDCSAGGCLIELAQQLAVIMIGKQIINNAQEILVPKIKAWWQKKQVKLSKKHKTRWEEDYQLINSEGLFQEYLEMVLQFGFITIFVAAFPLAPLFALLNNWVEIRLDAQKFVCETRRIVAERAENIGIWFKILDMLAHLAVISNAFLIAFTSEFLSKLLYQYEYDWNLVGYVNFTLAYAPPGTMPQPCRYRGLRDEDGNHTPFSGGYWLLD
ncbi:hypothetical protein ANN_19580, partial [Periplaneta americana]